MELNETIKNFFSKRRTVSHVSYYTNDGVYIEYRLEFSKYHNPVFEKSFLDTFNHTYLQAFFTLEVADILGKDSREYRDSIKRSH